MPNTITQQVLLDGERNLVVKVNISGDGSGDETDKVLIDFSAYTGALSEVRVMSVHSVLNDFTAKLSWAADTNVKFADLATGENDSDYSSYGGLANNAGLGKTGDILLTTRSLQVNNEGTIILKMKKRG